jgi:ABC-2 type transport system permease protein
MSGPIVVAIVLVALGVRLAMRRRKTRGHEATALNLGPFRGDVAMIAVREVRERLRGKVLRIGTLVILAVVAAAIIIPTLTKSKNEPERIGVLGAVTALQREVIHSVAEGVGTKVVVTTESTPASARIALRSGRVDVVLVDSRSLLVETQISPDDGSTNALFIESLSQDLGVANAMTAEGLTGAQALGLEAAKPMAVSSITSGPVPTSSSPHPTSIIGLVLTFIMLTQYLTWVLIGVMEEKSSRVVEVLLAAVRPIRLLFGKIIGIGSVALGQAAIIVVFALIVAKAAGSNILHGAAPETIGAQLLWLVLGYGFYCWVYAAAGSTVERQNQVQSLAFPLSLPILFGYIVSITAASSGSPSTLVKVLAYLPPTAPFAMPVLVSVNDVAWWQFAASALISVACTVLVAQLAATIYRRAILKTGGRIHLRELLSSSTG